jgi:hypothetical protein
MSADIGAWNSHGWDIRRLEAAPGVDVTEYTCVSCARHFLEEEGTHARYAVHVGIRQFHRLSDEVTEHWLAEKCPGKRLESDFTAIQTRFRIDGVQQKSGKSDNSPEGSDPNE